jgi:hypothetical protein
MAPLEGLVRITKRPQDPSYIGQARDPRVNPIEEGLRTVLLGVVEGDTLLQVGSGRGQLSQEKQDAPQPPVGLHEECWVLRTVGQLEELLSQLMCRLVLRPHLIKPQ